MSIKVIVAVHKACKVPSDKLYLPLQVGAEIKEPLGLVGDNTGENISAKNSTFCELTGLYWAWKNLPDEYIGLVHYRRYFASPSSFNRRTLAGVLTYDEAEALLDGRDGLLPKKREYFIDNLYDHYNHTSYIEPLDVTRDILLEKYPTYIPAFDRLKERTSAHMFNMFILRRDHLDAYCTWLFDVLFELEKRVDAQKYTAFHARFFGRISELMLDVWLENNPLDCATVPYFHVGKVNWLVKGTAFLKAKFF